MPLRVAVLLVTALVFTSACEEAGDCTIDFDEGDLDENLCEAVEQIVSCIEAEHGIEVEDLDDTNVESYVRRCHDELAREWCSMDPATVDVVEQKAITEIRGETNDCVANG